MTKEEAIEILSRPKSMKDVPAEILTAHNMAIQALEQEPCEDAIKYFNTIYELSQTLGVSYDFIDEKIKVLKNLPPVNPAEKVGHWIELDNCSNSGYYCSECQKKVVKEGWSNTVKKIKYCPNCGVKIREDDNGENNSN